MNILYLINHAGNGGSEKYVLELAESFLNQNMGNVHFIYNQDGPLRQRLSHLNIPTTQLTMNGPFDLTAAKKIADYCRKNKIDIVHTQFTRELYLAVLAKFFSSGARVLYTSHINLKNSRLRKILNRLICKKTDAIIAVCDLGRRLLIENKMPPDKIKLIYNGVHIKPSPDSDSNAIRQELSIPPECVVFVSLMRIAPEKGPMFLLESARKLATLTDKPFKVIISGDGDGLDEARKYADKYLKEIIILTGHRCDTDNILSGSDVFVNSSQSEALSFAILEAMSHGLPVIATDVGGNPEVVNDETKCGTLVPFGDTAAMSCAMLRYISSPELRKTHGQGSLAAVKNKFNGEQTLSNTFELYEKISL